MSDIVERLRVVLHQDRSVELMNREAADEIERLRAELAAMRQERDEAREEVCVMVADADNSSNPETAKEVAARRGWDCYGQGGGA